MLMSIPNSKPHFYATLQISIQEGDFGGLFHSLTAGWAVRTDETWMPAS